MELLEPGTTVMVITEGDVWDTGVVGTVALVEGEAIGILTHDEDEPDWYRTENLAIVPTGTRSYSANVADEELLLDDYARIDAVKFAALKA